jgi:ribosomal protein L44E
MPAYIQYHRPEPVAVFCPQCFGLPLHIEHVEPVWSAARVDVIYACEECGAEVRESVTRAHH